MSPPVKFRCDDDGHRAATQRPLVRDLEWNRLIKDMPVHEYCDWILAGRPGFADMAPHVIRAWQRARNG